MRRRRADIVRLVSEHKQVVVIVRDGRGDCAAADARPRRPRRGDVPVPSVPFDDGEESEVAGVGRLAPEVFRDERAVQDSDDIELSDIARFEAEVIEYVNRNYPELNGEIMSGKKLNADQQAKLRACIEAFKRTF